MTKNNEEIVMGIDFGKEVDETKVAILSIKGMTVLNLEDKDVDKKFEEIMQNARE